MIDFLNERRISAVIDATHPFAERISQNAAEACARAGVPLVRVERPPWPEEPGWRPVPGLKEAAAFFRDRRERVFLTVGKKELEAFQDAGQCFFLIRTIDPVESPVPIEGAEYIQGRGPLSAESERGILSDYGITWLVAKNSGGEAGEAKLIAAGELGVRVCMISRPEAPEGDSVESVDEALDWLARL
jgi:precorrin-6A/cobalt-precorrin-6A reductase